MNCEIAQLVKQRKNEMVVSESEKLDVDKASLFWEDLSLSRWNSPGKMETNLRNVERKTIYR